MQIILRKLCHILDFLFFAHHHIDATVPHIVALLSSGPLPMQLVVVMAVRKAVSAATNTFTAISMNPAQMKTSVGA